MENYSGIPQTLSRNINLIKVSQLWSSQLKAPIKAPLKASSQSLLTDSLIQNKSIMGSLSIADMNMGSKSSHFSAQIDVIRFVDRGGHAFQAMIPGGQIVSWSQITALLIAVYQSSQLP